MPFKKYTYNGVSVSATRRRPSSRDDKKYMREVKMNDRVYLVHYGDPEMPMRRDEPERREAFLTRHDCSSKKNPLAPGFWACYDWYNTREKGMRLTLQEVSEAIGKMVIQKLSGNKQDNPVLLKNGRRWIARYSNNAMDLQSETVTAKAHRDFVERFQAGSVAAPTLLLNHNDSLVLGKADRASIVETNGVVFPIFSGSFHNNVDDSLIAALHGKQMSHGMPYTDLEWANNDVDSGIIEKYNSVEFSVLVGAQPANEHTEFLTKGDEDMNIKDIAKELGVAETVIAALLQNAETDATTIHNQNIEVKSVDAVIDGQATEPDVTKSNTSVETVADLPQVTEELGMEQAVEIAGDAPVFTVEQMRGVISALTKQLDDSNNRVAQEQQLRKSLEDQVASLQRQAQKQLSTMSPAMIAAHFGGNIAQRAESVDPVSAPKPSSSGGIPLSMLFGKPIGE